MNARVATTALAALCLSGCVTLLPKTKPAQLYRFGIPSAAASPASAAPRTVSQGAGGGFTVRAVALSFDRAAASDRILTVNGSQAAYVAGSRWITSADSLFDAALTSAFEGHQGPARLLAPGEPTAADYTLKVDVRTFEARYDHGARAAPTVVVEAYAAMVRRSDVKTDKTRLFKAEAPASSNSMGGIVAAFDNAVANVLGQMVTWVGANGSG
jgi:cholesterol transport system auxiliary component